MEWSYYVTQYDKEHNIKSPPSVTAPDHCSAFVATGSYTKDGTRGHRAQQLDRSIWMASAGPSSSTSCRPRATASSWTAIPGFIHSGDDFGINAAGMMITETTISNFHGWDSNGIPEFVRGRKAMQYAASIDDFARIMKEGNNGGYANNWLVADRKTNEIADLELGLKNVTLQRTKDGYFVGSNFPVNEKLAARGDRFPGERPLPTAPTRAASAGSS